MCSPAPLTRIAPSINPSLPGYHRPPCRKKKHRIVSHPSEEVGKKVKTDGKVARLSTTTHLFGRHGDCSVRVCDLLSRVFGPDARVVRGVDSRRYTAVVATSAGGESGTVLALATSHRQKKLRSACRFFAKFKPLQKSFAPTLLLALSGETLLALVGVVAATMASSSGGGGSGYNYVVTVRPLAKRARDLLRRAFFSPDYKLTWHMCVPTSGDAVCGGGGRKQLPVIV
jgi:hypothetical protein